MNYENDAALGISATEFTRNAAASELFGQKFNDLTEIQKQQTLLKMVEDGNKLSGALGQAAREGEGFENVTGNLNQAWQNLMAELGKDMLGPVIKGIELVTAALQNFSVDDAVSKVRNIITESEHMQRIGDIVKKMLEDVKSYWKTNGEQIVSTAKSIWEGIKATVDFVMPAVLFVIEYVWGAIKNVITGALDIIMGVVKVFTSALNGDFSGMWEGIKQLFSGAVNLILGIMSLTFVGGIRTALANLSKTALNLVKNKWTSITTQFSQGVTKSVNFVGNLVRDVKNYFKDMSKNTVNTAKTMASDFVSKIKDMATKSVSAVKTLASDMLSKVKELPSKFLGIGKDMIQGLINGFKSLNPIKAVGDIATGMVNKVKEKFDIHSPSRVFYEISEFVMQGLANGIDDFAYLPMSQMEKMADGMIKPVGDVIDNVKKFITRQKELGRISVQQELDIWNGVVDNSLKGSKEHIEANKEYQSILKGIYDNATKINEEYQKKMETINDNLVKSEQDLTKAYEDAYSKRYDKLLGFADLFAEFKSEMEDTGEQLLANLQGQVDGFKSWQDEFAKLSSRGLSAELLEELSDLGVNALPELKALNSLTDEQLTQYSNLYQEKSELARLQTEKEMAAMKTKTQLQIEELRDAAMLELDELQKEWEDAIVNINKTTETEFKDLRDIGVNAALNLLNGLSSMEGTLINKARSIAEAINSALMDTLVGSEILDTGMSSYFDSGSLSGSSLNLGNVASPTSSSSTSSSVFNTSASKTQVNNITIQTTEADVEADRVTRRLAFGFI